MSSDKAGATPPAEPTKPAAPPTPAPRGHGKLIVGVLLVAVVTGVSIYWKQQTTAPPPDPLAELARDTPDPVPTPLPEPEPEPEPEPLVDDTVVLPEPAPVAAVDAPVATPSLTPAAPALEARLAELEASLATLARAPVVAPAAAGLVIEEVAALVGLAEQRLALARDPAGAASALRLAAARLTASEFVAQRRAVMTDLAALETFRDVDVAALSAELADFARRATGYAMAGPAPLAPAAPTASIDGWRGVVLAIWTSLLELVEVREADEANDPLLNPAHAALARQQLALDLSAARIALLQRDAASWRAALEPAIADIEHHFDLGDPAVAAALKRLRDIAAIDIAPVLPSLTRSVDALALAPLAAPAPDAERAESVPEPAPADDTPLSDLPVPTPETAL